MRSPGYWAAVRLVSFANAPISQDNWRTLWWSTDEYPKVFNALIGTEEPTERLQGPPPICLVLARSMRRYALKGRKLTAWKARGPRTSYDRPPAPWPKKIETRSPNSYDLLIRLQEKTRTRLTAICAKHREEELLRELRRYRTPTKRLQYDPKDRNDAALVDAREETLAAHLDGLFVNTFVAGLWDDFYQCPEPRCRMYGVKKLHSEQRITRSCGASRCRSRMNRSDRKRQQQALAKRVESEMLRLRSLPVDEMHQSVCRNLKLTRPQLLKVLARLPGQAPA